MYTLTTRTWPRARRFSALALVAVVGLGLGACGQQRLEPEVGGIIGGSIALGVATSMPYAAIAGYAAGNTAFGYVDAVNNPRNRCREIFDCAFEPAALIDGPLLIAP